MMDRRHAGLYLHVPFCRKKCAYCDFYSRPVADNAVLDAFSDAMKNDIVRSAGLFSDHRFDTVFVGGGTPTVLGPRLAGILRCARENFHIAVDAEVTVEANPESLTPQIALIFAESGVNRISIGAQSFDDEQLKLLGRIHTARETVRAVDAARAAGILQVNLDLIFGVPSLDGRGANAIDAWERTLESALALQPEHISAYSLKLEPGTHMHRFASNYDFPDEDAEEQMYQILCAAMEAAHFQHYEISNFSKAGCACRHNLKYWTGKPYLGLGPAAHSFINRFRTAVAPDLDGYIAGEQKINERTEIGAEEYAYEHLITSIRLSSGIEFDKLSGYYNIDKLNSLTDKLASNGLAKRTLRGIALTERGFRVSNAVIALLESAKNA